MYRSIKKVLCVLMVLVMVVGTLPVMAQAYGYMPELPEQNGTETEVEFGGFAFASPAALSAFASGADAWSALIASQLITTRGPAAILTADDDGIWVSNRGVGQYDHLNGIAFDLEAILGLAAGVVVFEGVAFGDGDLIPRGFDVYNLTPVTYGNVFSITIPALANVYTVWPEWHWEYWGGHNLPYISARIAGENWDYLITDITVDGTSILDLLNFTDITDDFTCDNFLAYVRELTGRPSPARIMVLHVENITHIHARNRDITSLDGIEHFAQLQELLILYNSLTSLSLVNNPLLEVLNAGINSLTELDVSNNHQLRYLRVSWGNNRLSTIDVSNNPLLELLDVGGNELTELDVSNNTALERLYVGQNSLSGLDLSNNPQLRVLNAAWGDNQISELDVSSNLLLEELGLQGNSLIALDVSNNLQLRVLNVSWGNNRVRDLDLSNNPLLEELGMERNALRTLDISNNPNLRHLNVRLNYLTELDTSNNPLLHYINIGGNAFESLDVTNNPLLESLFVQNNFMETRDDVIGWDNWFTTVHHFDDFPDFDNDATGFVFYPQMRYDIPFSLREFDTVQNLSVGELLPWGRLRATGATVSARNYEGVNYLHVSERAYNWHTVDIASRGILSGDVIAVRGRLLGSSQNAAIHLGPTSAPWDVISTVRTNPDTGIFVMEVTLSANAFAANGDLLPQFANGFRILPDMPDGATTYPNFNIYDIFINPPADWQSLPIPPVPVFKDITDDFTCPNFLAVVREITGRAYPERIYLSDVDTVVLIRADERGITSAAGIEHFTALVHLHLHGNQLTDLDLSHNYYLNDVHLMENNLHTLNISRNPWIRYLFVSNNNLNALDVSSSTLLRVLHVGGNNLTAIDVSNNTELFDLWVSWNRIQRIDVSQNTALRYLRVSSNELSTLDVSNNSSLLRLLVEYNDMETPDDVIGWENWFDEAEDYYDFDGLPERGFIFFPQRQFIGGIPFSLREYPVVQNLNAGDALAFSYWGRLRTVGATYTIRTFEGTNYISLTNRIYQWRGLDIRPRGVQVGDVIAVRGRVIGSDEGTLALFGETDEPWGNFYHTTPNADGVFVMVITLTEEHVTGNANFNVGFTSGFRINVGGTTPNADFNIYDIFINPPANWQTLPIPPAPPIQQPPNGGGGSSGGGGGGNGGNNGNGVTQQQPQQPQVTAPTPPRDVNIPANETPVAVRVVDGHGTISMQGNVRNQIRNQADYNVSFDLSEIEDLETVTVARSDWNNFASADLGIEFIMPVGILSFDDVAANSVWEQTRGSTITSSISIAAPAQLTTQQQNAINDGDLVVRITVMAQGQYVTEFDGYLSVTVPFDSELPVGVWHLAADGTMEQLYATFDYEAGTVTFVTNRLSAFRIAAIPTFVDEPLPVVAPPVITPALRFAVDSSMFTNRGVNMLGDVAPFIDPATNRTMIPLRVIAEGLGADVDWDENTRTVYIFHEGTTVSLTIGVPLPDGMGVAEIVDNRTFVPVRYVSEVLGADVRWDSVNRAVYIYQ